MACHLWNGSLRYKFFWNRWYLDGFSSFKVGAANYTLGPYTIDSFKVFYRLLLLWQASSFWLVGASGNFFRLNELLFYSYPVDSYRYRLYSNSYGSEDLMIEGTAFLGVRNSSFQDRGCFCSFQNRFKDSDVSYSFFCRLSWAIIFFGSPQSTLRSFNKYISKQLSIIDNKTSSRQNPYNYTLLWLKVSFPRPFFLPSFIYPLYVSPLEKVTSQRPKGCSSTNIPL